MENFITKKKEAPPRMKVVPVDPPLDAEDEGSELHPAWQALIRFCRDLGHGQIEHINIQNGLPVSAEIIKKKIRWC